MSSDLWVPNVANWFEKSAKLSYEIGDLFFIYDEKKYFFAAVVWFKENLSTFGNGGVVDDRVIFLHMLVNGDEIAINKSLKNDADYLDVYNLKNELRAYRNKELMQNYLSNQTLEFNISSTFSLILENKKLYCLYEDKKHAVAKIAVKNEKIVFKTDTITFEAKNEEMSDLSFLQNYTEEFIDLEMAYIKKQRVIETIKAFICIPSLLNRYFESYAFEGFLEFLNIALALCGVWLLVKYFLIFVYAPIIEKINRYFYKTDLKYLKKEKTKL